MRKDKIHDFLTEAEIARAVELYGEYKALASVEDRQGFVRAVAREIIMPNMERIDKTLGKENYAMYLALYVEYAITL